MYKIFLVAFLGLIAFSAFSQEITKEEGVLVLTTKNFDSAIKANEYILVEFYAPWCGHCKSLAPEYARAAQKLAKEGSDIKLGKVDATVESELGSRFQVRGYPSLKFFSNGNAIEYKGGRTETDIVNWVKRKASPPMKYVKNIDEFEDEIRENDVVIVFWAEKTHSAFELIQKIARGLDDAVFLFTSDAEIREKYQYEPESLITIYKRFDEGRVDYTDELEEESLRTFIFTHQNPIVFEFNDEVSNKIFGQSKLAGFIIFIKEGDQASEEAAEILQRLATEHRGKALFATANSANSQNNRLFEYFGVNADKNTPAVRIAKMVEGGAPPKYKFEREITYENLVQFLNDYLDGNLRPYLKSEPIPTEQPNAVKTVVAQNWKKVVLDPTKDVLIELYAPWCGHCKKVI